MNDRYINFPFDFFHTPGPTHQKQTKDIDIFPTHRHNNFLKSILKVQSTGDCVKNVNF